MNIKDLATTTRRLGRVAISMLALAAWPSTGWSFDTGVSDDRVSLPDGPGTLEGVGENVSVDSNMGLMSYAIPVVVPEGFEGITPSLAFTYSSGAGSSILGMGWSMATPSIERMTMRGVPRYDESDRFVVDGGRELVRISESVDAGQAAIYRTRFESDFTRYSWIAREEGRTGYWQAEYADGRVGYFGADAEGRLVPSAIEAGAAGSFEYHLVEMVDVYGHRVRYDYVKDGSVSLLSKVGYVFTEAAPTYQVELAYEGRADAVSDAKPGFDSVLTRRLSQVMVRARGQQLRRYALRYEDEALSGRRSRLATVESFGADDTRYPVVHSFGYSRGLGAECDDVDCGRPILTTMTGSEGLGVSLQSGTANLVDIDGDALPDLIDASTTQAKHRFFLNRLASDGTHTFSGATTSAIGEVSAFALGNPRVQFIDVNGDGFTDLLSGGTADQKVLLNRGAGDWVSQEDLPGSSVWSGADAELRFMDYDNDMDVDLIRSTATETFVFENDGEFGFTRRDIEPLGVAFSESIQFTDMNGDGLLEVVQMQAGQLQYKTNFGRGRFASEWTTLAHPFGAGEFDLALVEDIDSDGYADLVVATGNTVKYVLNRNGEGFEPLRTLSEAGGESLPNREATTTVLAADMNANGSVDIVWVSANGSVQYLDLFPVRSHLLTHIENGIGRVTDIAYETSVVQRARSAEAGAPWVHPLPHPMLVVSRTDEFDRLTNLHDVVDFQYRDGFYDGTERQFRGYAGVVETRPGDDSQELGRTVMRYDVGRDAPHRSGKLLTQSRESDGRPIDETTHRYGDAEACPVAEVPSNDRLAELGRQRIGFACEVATETLIQEGAPESEWVRTRTRKTYGDGYGNMDSMVEEGVVSIGGAGCPACERGAGLFGEACGNQCLGDERFVEQSFVSVDRTGGRWILDRVARTRTFGAEGGAGQLSEDVNHYDGEDFVGLPEGELTQGKLTRVMRRVDGTKQIPVTRNRFDVHGNAVETLDPLGAPDGASHRRAYTYDEDGLRVVRVEAFNQAPDGTAYRLRRDTQYDSIFDKVTLASAWMRVEGGTVKTSADPTAYTYDAFGRVESVVLPGGDSGAAPSVTYAYDLADPTTRIITRRRSEVGGPLDIETIACVDGRGRVYQTRQKLDEGAYQVDGFALFNLQSQQVRAYQSYSSDSAGCDLEPPAGTLFTTLRYDGVGRFIGSRLPDANAPGGASEERVEHRPLQELRHDAEDTDSASKHHATPTVTTYDGLGRTVAVERTLVDQSARTRLVYDGIGNLAGYVDAEGNSKTQTYDAMGRLLRIEDPNAGTSVIEYDDANNIVLRTDGRGVSVAMRYDGLNRVVQTFDPSDPDATRIETEYDASTSCDPGRCPNATGNIVARTYPSGADFFGYDVRRRLFSTVRVIEGQTYVLESGYDNADRMVERRFPDGRSLGYAYDLAGRVVGVPGVLDEVHYDGRGEMDRWVRASGVVDTRGYDDRQRLVSVAVHGPSGEELQNIAVVRDRTHNVLEAADSATATLMVPARFDYDAFYRSTRVDLAGVAHTMVVDRIESIQQRDGLTYTFDPGRPGAPSRVGDDAMTYDGAGFLESAYGLSHTWDFMGRLTRSEGAAGAVLSVYGADQMRVARHVDGELTHYVTPDFEVRDGVAVVYARLGRTRVARLESAEFARAWLLGGAERGPVTAGDAYLQREGADADRWLTASARRMLVLGRTPVVSIHHDHVRSHVMATDGEGQVVGRTSFGAFGAVDAETGFVDRYGFTGQEHEPHSGLVHFPFRSLSPRTGQWISPDPAFQALTPEAVSRLHEAVGRYAYVLNNPGTLVDPTGLHVEDGIRYPDQAIAIMADRRVGAALRQFAQAGLFQENTHFLDQTRNVRFGNRRRDRVTNAARFNDIMNAHVRDAAGLDQINVSHADVQAAEAALASGDPAQMRTHLGALRGQVALLLQGNITGMSNFYRSPEFQAAHRANLQRLGRFGRFRARVATAVHQRIQRFRGG